MPRFSDILNFLNLCMPVEIPVQELFETDVVKTSQDDLSITFIGHATLMLKYGDKVVHIDPLGNLADYSKLPKADLILVTHEHYDHLDGEALKSARMEKTVTILSRGCVHKVGYGRVMGNGDVVNAAGFKIEAVPAYNLVHMNNSGQLYHARGIGNGYIITCGEKRVYVAGDTENIPEMKEIKNIDIAFLPMNLPYTMTPEMVADAAESFKPRVLYPYHTGDTDLARLMDLMKDVQGIEIRLRKMK